MQFTSVSNFSTSNMKIVPRKPSLNSKGKFSKEILTINGDKQSNLQGIRLLTKCRFEFLMFYLMKNKSQQRFCCNFESSLICSKRYHMYGIRGNFSNTFPLIWLKYICHHLIRNLVSLLQWCNGCRMLIFGNYVTSLQNETN